jgi:hypothetical protein
MLEGRHEGQTPSAPDYFDCPLADTGHAEVSEGDRQNYGFRGVAFGPGLAEGRDMRKSLSLLLAIMIALLAFSAIAAATHSFSGDFVHATKPLPACVPPPAPDAPLLSIAGRGLMGA